MPDIDDDFPLADHPEYTGPKAGDPDMNRARDIRHYDVARKHPGFAQEAEPSAPAYKPAPVGFPETAPVMVAWRQWRETPGWSAARHNGDDGFALFMAGWAARDAQP